MKKNLTLSVLIVMILTAWSVSFALNNGKFEGFSIINVTVNGTEVKGDIPAVNLNGRTMVPVRFVSEALGAEVEWDPVTLTVHITKDKNQAIEPFPYVEIWLDEEFNVYRTAEENPRGNLTWVIMHNGEVVLKRYAESEMQYKYFKMDSGDYVIYMIDFVDGQYRVVSNVISYQIEETL